MSEPSSKRSSFFPSVLAVLAGAVYMVFFLAGESQMVVFGLLLGAALAIMASKYLRILDAVGDSARDHQRTFSIAVVAGIVAVSLYFYDDAFVLFLVGTVLVYVLTCLGLNIQFGFVGVLNFSGASFFGVGCYTAAVLTKHTATPHLSVILLGGLMAALLGFVILIPVLKTRGHYAALVTIAFALLFKTFLEVNDTLGGPQGLKTAGLNMFGWDFNQDIVIGSFEGLEHAPGFIGGFAQSIGSGLVSMVAFDLDGYVDDQQIPFTDGPKRRADGNSGTHSPAGQSQQTPALLKQVLA